VESIGRHRILWARRKALLIDILFVVNAGLGFCTVFSGLIFGGHEVSPSIGCIVWIKWMTLSSRSLERYRASTQIRDTCRRSVGANINYPSRGLRQLPKNLASGHMYHRLPLCFLQRTIKEISNEMTIKKSWIKATPRTLPTQLKV
jgi:hypothetical protein